MFLRQELCGGFTNEVKKTMKSSEADAETRFLVVLGLVRVETYAFSHLCKIPNSEKNSLFLEVLTFSRQKRLHSETTRAERI